ncbi:MAG: PLP-dependent aminotransferase family protein [Gammaproteobacteria bacterium]|nr:PLP-dependent aminotransferase family protein [Gammaproteobacteria bacterium]
MSAGRRATQVLWRQLLNLQPRAAASLQNQLRAQLIAAIGAGRLPPLRALPSSRALAAQLRIARNTVTSVYQQLAEDGYLIARRRQGYFPNPRALAPQARAAAAQPPGAAPDWNALLRFRPARQRHISKEADWQRYPYPFIYGQLDPALFPVADWRASCQQVLSGAAALDWAQDLITRDDPLLLEQIRDKVLPLRGVWAEADEILVTIGAQHALYLLADLLVGAHTLVGVENPGYPDARHIFAQRTSELRALPLDAHGLALGAALAECRCVYTTPSHQSPTTVTMPVERRRQLLRQAEADDFLIIEDDYETEVSFSGLPNPALKSLDRSGRVIYVGSLSKSLAPGLRLGYIVAPAGLIEELRALRRLMIRHPTAFIERSFAEFLNLGHYDSFNRRLAAAYRERAAVMIEAIARHLPGVHHPPVTGGSSVWLEGPPWLDARLLAERARKVGVLIEPGDVHFAEPDPPRHYFRLGFASIAAEAIPEGIRRLGTLLGSLRPRR